MRKNDEERMAKMRSGIKAENLPDLLTTPETMTLLGLGERYLAKLAEKGDLSTTTLEGKKMFSRNSVIAYAEKTLDKIQNRTQNRTRTSTNSNYKKKRIDRGEAARLRALNSSVKAMDLIKEVTDLVNEKISPVIQSEIQKHRNVIIALEEEKKHKLEDVKAIDALIKDRRKAISALEIYMGKTVVVTPEVIIDTTRKIGKNGIAGMILDQINKHPTTIFKAKNFSRLSKEGFIRASLHKLYKSGKIRKIGRGKYVSNLSQATKEEDLNLRERRVPKPIMKFIIEDITNEPDRVFASKQFWKYGDQSSVNSVLSQMVKKGRIKRVDIGLYKAPDIKTPTSVERKTPAKRKKVSAFVLKQLQLAPDRVFRLSELCYLGGKSSISSALDRLHKAGKIIKISNGHYQALPNSPLDQPVQVSTPTTSQTSSLL